MMSKKKEGMAPGSGKAQCSSVGQYQNREVGRGGWSHKPSSLLLFPHPPLPTSMFWYSPTLMH